MSCTSCNQGINGITGGSACCDLRSMDVDTPLQNIQNGDKNFCFTEITDKICESLANDEGIHPSATNQNNDCDDLSSLNDLATGSLHNALITLNMCDVNKYKCWLDSLLSWNWNVDKAIICALCGIWKKIHEIEKILIDSNGYISVTKIYTYTIPIDKFKANTGGNVMQWSGATEKGEDFINIPISEMDEVDTVIAQPQVAGNKIHAVTVAIQSAVRKGDNYEVNFDCYEIQGDPNPGNDIPFPVTIKFVVFGRKKVKNL